MAKLAKDDPSDVHVRNRLVALYLALNKTSDAQSVIAAALKKNPKDIDALFQQRSVALRLGNVADAEKNLKAVLAVSPNATRAHLALGNLYRSQRRLRINATSSVKLREWIRISSKRAWNWPKTIWLQVMPRALWRS